MEHRIQEHDTRPGGRAAFQAGLLAGRPVAMGVASFGLDPAAGLAVQRRCDFLIMAGGLAAFRAAWQVFGA